MSAKSCCVKVKNCAGKMGGMAESQAFLIEGAKRFTPKQEKRINKFWDKTLAEAEVIEKELFEAQE